MRPSSGSIPLDCGENSKLCNRHKIDVELVTYLDSVFFGPVGILDVGDFLVVAAFDPSDLLVPVGGAGEHHETADHHVPLVTVANVIWNMI